MHTQNHPDLITEALMRARSFIEGFEDDEMQENISEMLDYLDRALVERENRSLTPDELAQLERSTYHDANGVLQQ